MAFVAALAVLWETVPVLRGGVGNVVYFFAWSGLLAAGHRRGDGARGADADERVFSGFHRDADADAPDARRRCCGWIRDSANEFALTIAGPTAAEGFVWNGMVWSGVQVAARLAWVGYALLVALLAAVFFHRFDPARMGAGVRGRLRRQRRWRRSGAR